MMDGIEIFRHGKYDVIILDADINTYMFCSPMTNLYSSEVDFKPDICGSIFFIYNSLQFVLFSPFHFV